MRRAWPDQKARLLMPQRMFASLSTIAGTLLGATSRVVRFGNRLWRDDQSDLVAFRHREQFYRDVWMDAARRLGATVVELGNNIFELQRGDVRTKVFRNYCSLDDPVTLMLAGNKPLVLRLLQHADLPVPAYTTFSLATLAEATSLHDRVGRPCVVKPAKNTGGGKGVSTGITNRRQIVFAAVAAAAYDRELLMEEQVPGANYRLLYLDGRFIDAVRRDFPAVTGDGRATIAELVKQANGERLRARYSIAQTLLTIDSEMRRTLAQQDLNLSSVPDKGQRVIVKTVVNDNAGADNVSAAHLLCPDIISSGQRAAETIGVRLAGVDIITPDPSQPLSETGGRIIEVNTTPGFYIHYAKQDEPFSVAEEVLTAIFDRKGSGSWEAGGDAGEHAAPRHSSVSLKTVEAGVRS